MGNHTHARACAGRPHLYVYELPPRYRIDPRDAPAGLGAPVSLPPFVHMPLGIRLWHTAEFGLGSLFLQRAQSYQCLTSDPDAADLFLVPTFSSRSHNRPTERSAEPSPQEVGGRLRALFTRLRQVRVHRCGGVRRSTRATVGASGATPTPTARAARAAVRSNCSALEARGGADHILINPRNGAEFERHPMVELDYMDPRLGNATLLDLMEPGDWPWFGNYRTQPRYHSVPHPSVVHLEAAATGLPWRSEHPRASLIVGAFGVAHGPKEVVALRLALQRGCDQLPDATCKFHRLGAAPAGGGAAKGGAAATKAGAAAGAAAGVQSSVAALSPLREPPWHSISRLYWNATFCLQVPSPLISPNLL